MASSKRRGGFKTTPLLVLGLGLLATCGLHFANDTEFSDTAPAAPVKKPVEIVLQKPQKTKAEKAKKIVTNRTPTLQKKAVRGSEELNKATSMATSTPLPRIAKAWRSPTHMGEKFTDPEQWKKIFREVQEGIDASPWKPFLMLPARWWHVSVVVAAYGCQRFQASRASGK